MYICSGDKNWTDRIGNYILSQFFKFARMMLCSNVVDFQLIKQMININEYKVWLKSTEDLSQIAIRSCMDESVVHLMKLTVCCGDFSKQILDSVQNLVCSHKTEDNPTAMCRILTIATRFETQGMLIQIIEKSNICHDNCPLGFISDVENNLKGRNKRQFDLASTFAGIGQFACSDVLKGSTQYDDWSFLMEMSRQDHQSAEHEYLRYMILVRRPLCCLLQNEIRG
ncbi:hypothetical protein ACHWQZ_G002786 [Mnemiopsis leidyi]